MNENKHMFSTHVYIYICIYIHTYIRSPAYHKRHSCLSRCIYMSMSIACVYIILYPSRLCPVKARGMPGGFRA